MSNGAEFISENNSAADQRGTTAPESSRSHEVHGGPRQTGSGEFVMAGNVRRAGSGSSRRWRFEQKLSARSVEEARALLGMSKTDFAILLDVSRSTALAYETNGTITLSAWMLIETELRARDLLREFDARMRQHEIALRTKRTA